MKAKELRLKDELDLKTELIKTRKNLFNLRFQAVSGSLENTSQIKNLKKDVAKIKTVLTEKIKKLK
jgi:large subunit ribosomal protein L29